MPVRRCPVTGWTAIGRPVSALDLDYEMFIHGAVLAVWRDPLAEFKGHLRASLEGEASELRIAR